jgi:hypothetical protein
VAGEYGDGGLDSGDGAEAVPRVGGDVGELLAIGT